MVLDIGGDRGAVVVTMPFSMVGQEVDIVPVGADRSQVDHGHDDDHGHGHGHGHGQGHGFPHVAVVRRPLPSGGEIPSLVYPSVVEGSYELCLKGTEDVVLEVQVIGGQVTTVVWPEATPS